MHTSESCSRKTKKKVQFIEEEKEKDSMSNEELE